MSKIQKIVYESENGGNTIIDDGENYILLHANGKAACFDRNRKILNRIKRAINKDGNFQMGNSGFYMTDYNGRFLYGLAQLIISTAYNKKLGYIRKGVIRYLDNNACNCCLENLDSTKISNARTSPFKITHDSQHIYVKHKPSGEVCRLTYIPDLYEAINSLRWVYNGNYHLFYTVICEKNKKNKNIQLALHQLAYIFYYYNGVTKRNYKSKIKEYKENFEKFKLEVDHLDSNRMNDCKFNISAIEKSLNVRKSDITQKIVYPFFHFAVYIDGAYRVAIGMYFDSTEPDGQDEVIIQGYQCNTAEAYIDLLKTFYDQGILPNGEGLPMEPKKWYFELPEKKRQQIDEVLPKIDRENIIKMLLGAADLPLYEGKKDIKHAS